VRNHIVLRVVAKLYLPFILLFALYVQFHGDIGPGGGFAAVGLLIYAGTGVAALLLGGNFLGYGVLEHDPVHGQHLGIFIVELGVGISVFAAMVSVFFAFVARER